MNKNTSIFDDVQLINEGILAAVGGFLLALPILAGATVIACATISGKVNKGKEKAYKKKLNKILAKFAKEDPEVNEFNEKAEHVKGIALSTLSEKIKMDSKSIDLCKKNNAGCYVIEDKDGNVIAYAIFDFTNNKYSYKITDGNDKNQNLNNFVAASFELQADLIGDACKKFLDVNFNKTYSNTYHDITSTDEEFESVMNNMQELSNIIKTKIKSIAKSISIEDDFDKDYRPYLNKSFNSNKSVIIDYTIYVEMRDQKEYYDEEESNFDEKMYNSDENKLISTCIQAAKSLQFKTDSESRLIAKDSDKYPGFNIYLDNNPDDDAFKVTIAYNKTLKK